MLPAQLLESFRFDGKQLELGKMRIVDAKGAKFDRALRVQTLPGRWGNIT